MRIEKPHFRNKSARLNKSVNHHPKALMGSGLTLGILKMLQSSALSMSAHNVCQDMHSKIYGKKEIDATFLHYQPRDLRSLLGGDSSQHSLEKKWELLQLKHRGLSL